MGRNRSLDEFLGGADADGDRPAPEDATDGGEEAVDGTEESAPGMESGVDSPGVEPMAETFAWSASGGACAGCGERVETRWRDGGTLVCGDCKAW